MSKLGTLVLTAALVMSTGGLPGAAQQGRGNSSHNNSSRNNTRKQSNNDRSQFYNGANREIRGGNYGDRGRQNYRNNQGGIGPGKGALIGGAGGAALGAVFGGGVKGALITGAAGAGIGAILGGVAQNNRNNNYRR